MRQTILIGIVFILSGCVLATPPETKFTVRVVDTETGIPIINAVVKTTFTQNRDPWGTGEGKFNRVEVPVDQNGEAVLLGCTMQRGEGGTAFAEEYYSDVGSFRFTGKDIVLNRWKPWNPTIEVKLRPKKNPVPMVCRERHYSVFKVPFYDQPIGYDLEKQDFISPHGKGIHSDLFFEFKRDFKNSQNFDVSCKMSFQNEFDGIQECYFDEGMRSSYKWPYLAPPNNYKSSMTWRSTRSDARPVVHNFDEKLVNYIFRVRTRVDDEGNIISACYGKIAGPFGLGWADRVNWVYWFNPVPNERSLEYNGENLLKKK